MFRLIKNIIIIAVIGYLGYYGYMRFFGDHMMGGGMMGGAPPVGVAEVIESEAHQWREFSGRLVAVDSAMIRPRVAGTVEKIHFKEGEWVKKGQPLFTIDQKPYFAALQAAEAQAKWADTEMTRAEMLLMDKAIPQREYDMRVNNWQTAQSALTKAQLDYGYTTIRAPISGRVSRAEVTVGNLVNGGGDAPVLTSVVSNAPIYADFDVDEPTFVKFMQPFSTNSEMLANIPVQLELGENGGAVYEGRVQSFDNQLDIASGTIRVRTIFENKDGSLIPGLFARVRLGEPNAARAILISERVIGTDQNKKFVIVVGAENKTERREITLGGMADGMRIITSGLNPGEKIIVSGTQRVMMPGMPVTPEMVNMDGSPLPGSEAPATNQEQEKAPE